MKHLFAVLGLALGLSLSAQTARLQVIHNSADMAADSVDVYLGSTLLLPDFKFRTATPFIDAPADTNIVVGIAPGNSSSVSDTIFSVTLNLPAGGTFVAVANGIVSGSGYSPATPFAIYPAGGREMAAQAGNTDILVFHGATDAPNVSVDVAGLGNVIDTLAYGEFDGYLEVPTIDAVLEVRSEDGGTLFASYDAPLSTLGLQDSAIVVLASGFLNPANNSGGAGFGLWAALATGGDLVELPVNSGLSTVEFETQTLELFPNPSNGVFRVNNTDVVSAELIDIAGNTVKSWNNQDEFDASDVAKGVYFFRAFNSENEVYLQRVVLQ